jgi:hypothetical protein
VHFIHCGGKNRIPIAIKALKRLNVPICVIADFDIPESENPFRNVYDSLGGVWEDVRVDWINLKRSIDDKRPEL